MNALGAFVRVAAFFDSEQSRRWDARSGIESHSITGLGLVSNNVRGIQTAAVYDVDSPSIITKGK
jgi:hypothetical protein